MRSHDDITSTIKTNYAESRQQAESIAHGSLAASVNVEGTRYFETR
jgi:hypothetical protein